MDIEVSIIVPVYNVEKYLPNLFDSLKKQTFKNFEVILVNDGSTDNSYQLCINFAKKYRYVTVINQLNQGIGSARNTGIKQARGKYLYFCDPDDYFDADLLAENIQLAERYQAEVIVFGFEDRTLTGKLLQTHTFKTCFYQTKAEFRQAFPTLCAEGLLNTVWNQIYLRDTIKELRFKKISLGEDFHFNLDLSKNLSRVFCNEKIYYHYLVKRPGSATSQAQLSFKVLLMLVKELKHIKQLVYQDWQMQTDPTYQQFINKQSINIGMYAWRLK